jgi:hypothetical protein
MRITVDANFDGAAVPPVAMNCRARETRSAEGSGRAASGIPTSVGA